MKPKAEPGKQSKRTFRKPNHARRGSAKTGKRGPKPAGALRLYGLHTVRAALANPRRTSHALHVTPNALERLGPLPDGLRVEQTDTMALNRMVGSEAVHQGLVLDCEPLERLDGSELHQLADERLVLVLDQVTDPHNVGAILRSAVAMGAGAVLATVRNAPPETGVLAKSASGALDHIVVGEVRLMAKALGELSEHGFLTVGLDSEGAVDLPDAFAPPPERVALVLGAEGRGLREGTREACSVLARLDMPGPIRSLNVSNAAVLALYLARRALGA